MAFARLAGRFTRRGKIPFRNLGIIHPVHLTEFLAVLIVTAVVFTKGLSAALAWRGYKAVGGEFMLLLLPIIYYEAKRIILDFVADFVELYRRAED